ncbi:hypothetical protein RM53_15435 [Brevundimonas nasdae]|jgi:hypothetical protein|uniref:Uncharacterized protein n=1 Tax=Brevundimonas nasdae TaxID=172043 RepID=A0A0B4C2D0_9CAUL|nr:hypothetical protein [Brevundimonas nasdae]KIC55184.1 hypothetical protein RM53_15435 [Brevundimonas nasdae]
MTQLTEAEWEERFVPVAKRGQNYLLFDGYRTDERAFLEVVGNNRIWTHIDAEGAVEYIPGFWRVNAMGYIVTMNPWAENEADLVVEIDLGFERDEDEDDEEDEDDDVDADYDTPGQGRGQGQ